jgi:hypothetical protein
MESVDGLAVWYAGAPVVECWDALAHVGHVPPAQMLRGRGGGGGAGAVGGRCGARVLVLEQRRSFTRANILKLWPFMVHDLRTLGAKVFFPQFCTGGLTHIGTRRLQQLLLKDALLLGVRVEYGLEFLRLARPAAAAAAAGAGEEGDHRHWHVVCAPRRRSDGTPADAASPALLAEASAIAAELGSRCW